MSYTKTTWKTGDVITAEKLKYLINNMKGGYEYFLTEVIYNVL